MTQNQYYKLAQNFMNYAKKEVEFKSFDPSTNKFTTGRKAMLKGIGMGCNADCIILAQYGYSIAIPYSYVKFPD